MESKQSLPNLSKNDLSKNGGRKRTSSRRALVTTDPIDGKFLKEVVEKLRREHVVGYDFPQQDLIHFAKGELVAKALIAQDTQDEVESFFDAERRRSREIKAVQRGEYNFSPQSFIPLAESISVTPSKATSLNIEAPKVNEAPLNIISEPTKGPAVESWYGTWVDLTKVYPLSRLWVLKESFEVVFFTVLKLIFFFSEHGLLGFLHAFNDAAAPIAISGSYREFIFMRVSLLVMVLSLIYYEVKRRNFRYGLNGFRLHIKKGVIKRVEGSVGLHPTSEVYVRRTFFERIFGLAHVVFFSPLDKTRKFSTIEGLTPARARAVRDILVAQLNKQVSVAKDFQEDFAPQVR
jgi:membrane protein YdbS with pleckstrin-like domain